MALTQLMAPDLVFFNPITVKILEFLQKYLEYGGALKNTWHLDDPCDLKFYPLKIVLASLSVYVQSFPPGLASCHRQSTNFPRCGFIEAVHYYARRAVDGVSFQYCLCFSTYWRCLTLASIKLYLSQINHV